MLATQTRSYIRHLKCAECSRTFPVESRNTFATCEENQCSNPLVTEYEFTKLRDFSPEDLKYRDQTMWRYREMLPVLEDENIVSLGEGMTPILDLPQMGRQLGMSNLLLKDESLNPTGSFKARGLSMAISKAKELGIGACIIPTAGNAGGAMSAYCSRAGIEATVVMPSHTPEIFRKECQLYGAQLILVDGLISDCAHKVAELNREGAYFDISTLKEPYRLEGKKTMGYEIAEQLDWNLPDVILYPTGGGTGLIGIWKAFQEMLELGWVSGPLPRMVAVQTENCDPMVQAWEGNPPKRPRPSLANGLAVPKAFGKNLILRTLYESKGMALSVSESELLAGVYELSKAEGLIPAPEGGALVAACQKLLASYWMHPDEQVVLLNTGTGYKYFENLS